jgi:hypothetical protein
MERKKKRRKLKIEYVLQRRISIHGMSARSRSPLTPKLVFTLKINSSTTDTRELGSSHSIVN